MNFSVFNTACPLYPYWHLTDKDWELGLWGRDRWFPLENLELGISIRWDRFHYLEKSDYISPRLQVGFNFNNNLLFCGGERLISPPGYLHLDSEGEPLFIGGNVNAVTEPSAGFRWFGGIEKNLDSKTTVGLKGYYTVLSSTIIMVPTQQINRVDVYQPVSGEGGKKVSLQLDTDYRPWDWYHMYLSYVYTHSRLAWPGNLFPGRIQPNLEYDTQLFNFNSKNEDTFPTDNDTTHSVYLSSKFRFEELKGLNILVDFIYSSGRPYTPKYQEQRIALGEDVIPMNNERGPDWYRIDLVLKKSVRLGERLTAECNLSVKNLLNSWQDPPIDTVSGKASVSPFSSHRNMPRIISAGVSIYL